MTTSRSSRTIIICCHAGTLRVCTSVPSTLFIVNCSVFMCSPGANVDTTPGLLGELKLPAAQQNGTNHALYSSVIFRRVIAAG